MVVIPGCQEVKERREDMGVWGWGKGCHGTVVIPGGPEEEEVEDLGVWGLELGLLV